MNIFKSVLLGIWAISLSLTAGCNSNVTVKDADGNIYQTVKIGNQVWTRENLRTTKYNDHSAIPLVTDNSAWSKQTTPGYCYYQNTTDPELIKKFGALYNWYAVDSKKLAPKGWHVPTDEDWKVLETYLIAQGYNWDGTSKDYKIAKALAAQSDWRASTNPGNIGTDLKANNKSGFAALPGGSRSNDGFSDLGSYGGWWSATAENATDAYHRSFSSDRDGLYQNYGYMKSCGLSIRLVRDLQ
jgi:uncharacterized protein (TIGR02145 family)